MADDIYNQIATEEPDTEDDILSDEILNAPKSSAEQEAMSPNDSDLIATLKKLLPAFPASLVQEVGQAVLQSIMVSRVFPESYLDRMYLTVVSIIEAHKYDSEPPDVMMIINIVDVAFSIGYDGKTRVELLILLGNARQAGVDKENGGLGN